MLLFRLAIGVFLTWRLARAATPISESWTGGLRVRVSDLIGGPVTFASTILLPPHYRDWDSRKRRAVLALCHQDERRMLPVVRSADARTATGWP